MGWKSAKYITRREAEQLAMSAFSRIREMSDSELGEYLQDLGYGDDTNLEYYGRSIYVSDMQAEYEED